MKLSELLEQLTYGELSQLSIGNAPEGEIKPCDYARLGTHINMGLTALHTRFLLREAEVIVQQYDSVNFYNLTYDYAQSNVGSIQPIKYLMDSVSEPFQDNVLRVERVINEEGDKLGLNDETDEDSLYTPKFDQLQIPDPVSTNAVSVIYRANHEKLVLNAATDPSTITIELHPSFYQALLFFVASRMFSPMGSTEVGNEGNNYYGKFEAECLRLEKYNPIGEAVRHNQKAELHGWV